MNVMYLVVALTGLYDATRRRIVAAYSTLAQAEAHRAAAQVLADSLIAKAHAEGQDNYVSDVNGLDLDMEIWDGFCSYALDAVLAPQPGEPLGNFLQHGALLGAAQAEIERNRRLYDKRYAQMMAEFEAKQGPKAPQEPITGTFASKLQAALHP